MYTSTLTRSSSGKELLLPFGEFFHALQGFLLRYNSSRGTFNLDCFEGFSLFHKTSALIFLYPGNMSMRAAGERARAPGMHCEVRLYVRTGGLLAPGEIRSHDTWPECEHVGIACVSCDVDPVVVGSTERLDAGKVFECRGDIRVPHPSRA